VFRDPIAKGGGGPRLELFGHQPTAGWVVWGNEVERNQHHQGVEDVLDAEEVENSEE
jgi:hypothetical protein